MTIRAWLWGAACLLCTVPAWANPDVTSREYKITLDTQRFTFANEYQAVSALIDDARQAVEQAIDRDVRGTPTLAHQRSVQYFDVPGQCTLNRLGFSFRERIEDRQSEATLKFRSADRYIADFEDVSSPDKSADSKLEADIGADDSGALCIAYGHSTKVDNTRTINKINDIDAYFPGFAADHPLDEDLALAPVAGLLVHERVYKNVEIDLGQFDAEISVTLWYRETPAGNDAPIIAELSFRYEDPSADYSRKVVNRAKTAFDALQHLSGWPASRQIGKTRFVYASDPAFCQP